MREIRVHGQDKRYHHPRLGINGRLDSLQAAILLAKMEIFEDEVQARSRLGARYSSLLNEVFAGKGDVTTPVVEAHNLSVYAQYTIQVPNRPKFEERMKAQGIPTAVHYPVPLYRQPVFASLDNQIANFPESELIASRVVSLPMHPYLTEEHQQQVVAAVRSAVLG